jgi:hypothetical protein
MKISRLYYKQFDRRTACFSILRCKFLVPVWFLHIPCFFYLFLDQSITHFLLMMLTDRLIFHIHDHKREVGRDFEASCRCLLKISYPEICWWYWEKSRKAVVTLVEKPVEIRTVYLPTASPQRYHHTKQSCLGLVTCPWAVYLARWWRNHGGFPFSKKHGNQGLKLTMGSTVNVACSPPNIRFNWNQFSLSRFVIWIHTDGWTNKTI